MDDTVFDHSLSCRAALVATRREFPFLRRTPLDEQWRSYLTLLGATHGPVMLGRRNALDARRERLIRLAAAAGRSLSADEGEQLSQTYRGHYQRLRRPVPGAPETLRRLRRRARIGIVTNNTLAEQTEKLGFLGLADVVDPLVTSEEIGFAKPDPRIFAAALRRGGARPAETVMVGDSWSGDVEGARSAGIRPIWFNRFRIPRPGAPAAPEFASFRSGRVLETLLAP